MDDVNTETREIGLLPPLPLSCHSKKYNGGFWEWVDSLLFLFSFVFLPRWPTIGFWGEEREKREKGGKYKERERVGGGNIYQPTNQPTAF